MIKSTHQSSRRNMELAGGCQLRGLLIQVAVAHNDPFCRVYFLGDRIGHVMVHSPVLPNINEF